MWVTRLLLLTITTALLFNVNGGQLKKNRNESRANIPSVEKKKGQQTLIAFNEGRKIRSPRDTTRKMQVTEKKKPRRKKLQKEHVEAPASIKLRVEPVKSRSGKRRPSRANGVAQKYSKKSNVTSLATPSMRHGRSLVSEKSDSKKRTSSTTTALPTPSTLPTSTTTNQSSITNLKIKNNKMRSCTDKMIGELKKGRCKRRKRRALKTPTMTAAGRMSETETTSLHAKDGKYVKTSAKQQSDTTKSTGTTLTAKSVLAKKKRGHHTSKSISTIPIKINLLKKPYCIVYFPSNGTIDNDKEACSKLINLNHFERREKDGCYFYSASTRRYKPATGLHRCDGNVRVAYRFLDKSKTKCVPTWRKYSSARTFLNENCTQAVENPATRERIRRKRCIVLETLPNSARIACAVYDKCKGGALVNAAVKCKDYPARLIRADGHCYIRKSKVKCATQATSDALCHVPGRPNNFGGYHIDQATQSCVGFFGSMSRRTVYPDNSSCQEAIQYENKFLRRRRGFPRNAQSKLGSRRGRHIEQDSSDIGHSFLDLEDTLRRMGFNGKIVKSADSLCIYTGGTDETIKDRSLTGNTKADSITSTQISSEANGTSGIHPTTVTISNNATTAGFYFDKLTMIYEQLNSDTTKTILPTTITDDPHASGTGTSMESSLVDTSEGTTIDHGGNTIGSYLPDLSIRDVRTYAANGAMKVPQHYAEERSAWSTSVTPKSKDDLTRHGSANSVSSSETATGFLPSTTMNVPAHDDFPTVNYDYDTYAELFFEKESSKAPTKNEQSTKRRIDSVQITVTSRTATPNPFIALSTPSPVNRAENNQQPFQTNGFLLDDRSDQLTTQSEHPTEGISTQRPGTDELLALSTMYRQMTQVPQISSTEIYRPRPMHSTSQFEILMEQHQTRPPSVHHLGVVTSHLPEDDCFTRFTDPKNVPEECPLTQPGERLCLKANEFMSNMENVPMLLLMENEDKERFAADISHIVDDKQNNNGYSKYSDVPFIASSFKDYTVSKMIRYFASCLTGGNTCTFLTTYMTNVTNFHRPCKLG